MKPVVVRLSDSVEIWHADCRDVLPVECDAVVTDPPYGMEATQPMRRIKRAVTPKQKDGHLWGRDWGVIAGDDVPYDPTPWISYGIVAMWGANHYCEQLPRGKRWLVWHKETPDGMCASDCELAWTSVDGGSVRMITEMWIGFRRKVDIREHYHPTQKPTTVMAWTMEQICVPKGATVLDPYMGSGTTGIACIRTGRKFIGVEKDARYFEIARQRLENELRQGLLPLTYDNKTTVET